MPALHQLEARVRSEPWLELTGGGTPVCVKEILPSGLKAPPRKAQGFSPGMATRQRQRPEGPRAIPCNARRARPFRP